MDDIVGQARAAVSWTNAPELILDLIAEIERLRTNNFALLLALKRISDFPYIGLAASQEVSMIARAAIAKAEVKDANPPV